METYSKSFAMCGKKKGYASDFKASFQIGIQQAKHPGLKLRMYKCPLCNMYHITHKPRL